MIKKLSLADLKGWTIYFDDPSKEMILIYKGDFCAVSVGEEAIDDIFELEVFSHAIKQDKEMAKRVRNAFWDCRNKSFDRLSTTLSPKYTNSYTAFIRLIKKVSLLTGCMPAIYTSSRAIKVDIMDDNIKKCIFGLIIGARKR